MSTRTQYTAQELAAGSPAYRMSSASPNPTGNRAQRRAYAKRTKRPMPKPATVQRLALGAAQPETPSTPDARCQAEPVTLPEPAEAPEPATEAIPDDRAQQPLSDETRQALLDLAQRLVDDPDGLIADRQQRALDRLHGHETPECGHRYAGQTCTRPADHTARSERSRRHATACGTIRWEG